MTPTAARPSPRRPTLPVAVVCAIALVAPACSSSDASQPDPPALIDDARLPPDEPHLLEINTLCGVAVLSRLVDGSLWITDEAAGVTGDWTPSEWSDPLNPGEQLLTIEVVLSTDGERLTASHADRSVIYRRLTADDPEALCA